MKNLSDTSQRTRGKLRTRRRAAQQRVCCLPEALLGAAVCAVSLLLLFQAEAFGQAAQSQEVSYDQATLAGHSEAAAPGTHAAAASMQGQIAGTVVDSLSGEPLPGVNVVVEGTQQGASTDAEGTYTIAGVEPGTYDVRASFVGYAQKVVENVGVEEGAATTVDFALRPSTVALDEVVAVGYGTQRRQDLTGAISSIDAEDIETAPVTGIDEALQGRIPGVTVSPNSGQPGAPIDVNVRGIGSFGNSNPLYVIDGVPVSNDISNIGLGQSNPLALISTDNIESIEVLKDASASAIYGARGANGVVLITTKKGVPGNLQVNFNSSYGIQRVTKTIGMANSQQYAEMANDADDAAGIERQAAFNDPEVLRTNTRWEEEAFRTAPVMSHNLTVSGGDEDVQYLVSGGLLDQEGVLINSGFTRYTARINTSLDLSSWIRIGETLNLSRGKWYGGYSPGGDQLHELLQSAPTLPVRNEENLGGYAGPGIEVTGRNLRANRIAIWNLRQNEKFQNRILGNAFAEVDLLPGLTYRLDAGLDLMDGNAIVFDPARETGQRSNPTADLSEDEIQERTYLFENTLSYDKTFADQHSVSATVGYTQQSSQTEFLDASITEFPNNDLRVIDAGTGQSSLSGSETEWAIRSFLARVNYSYVSKYLLTATIRRDGSSRFGSNNRWGNFPSFSLGWVISEEPFMDNVSFVDQLKIRGSWGKTGNQNISNYAALSTVENFSRYILGRGQSMVIKMPKGVAVGLVCQFTIMPIVGFSLATAFGFPNEIAAGVVLIGSAPGGMASNVMAYIAEANLALSITMTAVATLISPIMTPFLMELLAGQFVPIDFVEMMWGITKMVILPIVAGLLFNHFFHGKAKWLDQIMPVISMAAIVIILAIITAAGRDALLTIGLLLVLTGILHNLAGYVLGYWGCRLLGLEENTCRTISLEVGMQNAGLASGIALQMGRVATVGLAPAVFGPWMNISGSAFELVAAYCAPERRVHRGRSQRIGKCCSAHLCRCYLSRPLISIQETQVPS